MKIWIVSTRGYEGEFEPVAAFSSSEKAYEFIKQKEFRSWSVDDLKVDEPEE
ncbi:hypothetical protein GKR54_15045 [Providencia alcalifaciens]|uniref:hypothetical protein n=1 Tax=Providencia alcalifaciens TaxID=126385 RepID=UPI0012B60DD3|nr:hypothetical protein [Providencia alcalifaciens]MTC32396.1 hypothetical protein [Providencia alcalifaciens]